MSKDIITIEGLPLRCATRAVTQRLLNTVGVLGEHETLRFMLLLYCRICLIFKKGISFMTDV